MKTLAKWLLIICAVGWAAQNPAAVSADIGSLMGAGRVLVNSVAGAVGSGISGVSSGISGGSGQAPAAPAPAAPAH